MADSSQVAAARAELARRELARRASLNAPPAAPVTSAAAASGFGRGGRAPTPETLARMRDNPVSNTLAALVDDPYGTLQAGAAGFNRGVAGLAGIPMDAARSATDLAGMAYGGGMAMLTGKPAGEFYEPYGNAPVFGTSDYLAQQLDRGTSALGAGPVTQNPRPNNPAARLAFGIGSGIPGAATGRAAISGGASGAASELVAEAGGGTAAQALAGIAGGRAGERVPSLRSPAREAAQAANTGTGSAGAAAAGLDIANVAPELRQPLQTAFMRGDRDVAARVVKGHTLPIPIDYTEGQARQDSSLMADEWNLRGTDKDVANRFDEQNQGLIDNLDEIRRTAAPNVVANDHIQNGQTLIDSYKAYDAPVREQITADYKALEEANGGQLPINAKSFVDAADAALAKKLKARYLPAGIKGDMDQFRESGGMMTFEQYENLRTNLATEARTAERQGNGNAAAAINVVRKELETMPFEGVSANLKALADKARNGALARFEALDADPAYRAAVDDDTPTGELSPFADDFVKKFVINGKAANIKRMQERLAADPIAAETVAAAALNYVKAKSGVNPYTNQGNFSQAGFNRALGEIRPKLAQLLPGKVSEVMEQLGEVAQELQIQRKGGTFNNSNTFSAAAASTAKNMLESGLNSALPGAQLGTTARNRRADARAKARAQRSLDPRKYLTSDTGE